VFPSQHFQKISRGFFFFLIFSSYTISENRAHLFTELSEVLEALRGHLCLCFGENSSEFAIPQLHATLAQLMLLSLKAANLLQD
jgi:hypothetical protein